ncbi:MAG: hypothetical protein JWQ06_131 [Mucilaginibacter sp.]|nr:hypothetical protein [Mucilaginibacter sp.]
MNEQFNNNLKNRVREVFENFEDPSADEGWLLLRKKFPKKEKDRGVIWLWRGLAAAILLLLLGIGTWVNYQQEEPKKLAYKRVKTYQEENKLLYKNQPIIKNKKPDGINKTDTDNTVVAVQVLPKNHVLPKNNLPLIATKTARIKNKDKAAPKPPVNNYIAENSTATINADKSAKGSSDKLAASNNNQSNLPMAVNDTISKDGMIASAEKPVPRLQIPSLTNNKTNELKYREPVRKKEDKLKKVEFGIYAATYFNYAKGSNTQLNLGAGVTSDIKLSKNLKLSTGIAIAQNTLNFANQIPVVQQSLLSSNIQHSSIASAYLSNTGNTSPTFKNYNAQLVALDVPVNLKYEFNPQKNSSYVLVGLSSGTFINESYTYQYNYSNTFLTAPQTQSQTTNNSFSNFYFAKTLNVSFGLGYPLGKNHLIVEPFLKYPLNGLGQQQIRFGAGGLNLKFDFKSSKK